MRVGTEALETLVTVCDEGSFVRAAARLHITTGAVSQRIAGLEKQIGHPVVERGQPTTPTLVGHELLRLGRQTLLLQQETAARLHDLHASDPTIRLAIALNADSLSTWFRPVIQSIAATGDLLLDLRIADQDHTASLLRSGSVVAAVTTNPNPGPGCTTEILGTMRYLPVCSPALAPRPGETLAGYLVRTPTLQFDKLDTLPFDLLDQLGVTDRPPAHYIPSNREYFDAVHLGLGWSVLPEGQLGDALRDDDLVLLDPGLMVEVTLHWQRWRIESPTLDTVSSLVRQAAQGALH